MQANKSGAQKLPRLARNGEMATRQMANGDDDGDGESALKCATPAAEAEAEQNDNGRQLLNVSYIHLCCPSHPLSVSLSLSVRTLELMILIIIGTRLPSSYQRH